MEPGSADHVLITWALCTIPDSQLALSEICRVLRPGGSLRFAEHGLSPGPQVACWPDRLTPVQRKLAGGCHLNRPIGQLVADSGLEVTRMDTYYAGARNHSGICSRAPRARHEPGEVARQFAWRRREVPVRVAEQDHRGDARFGGSPPQLPGRLSVQFRLVSFSVDVSPRVKQGRCRRCLRR